MDLPFIFQKLAIALGLGLLVGLQRERTSSAMAGVRTYPLVALFGALCALLTNDTGSWMLVAGLLALVAILVIGNLAKLRAGQNDPGLTSEMAMLLMYAIGAHLIFGDALVAVVLAGTVAVLLHLKPELHGLVRRIEDKDFRAVMQFVVIALVILPVLPDKAYGPFGVLNPQKIWWMVVLITGISLGGYVVYKRLGNRAGAVVGGLLGGLISSTATTVSYARRSRESAGSSRLLSLVIMLSSSVVFARVIFTVGILAPHLFQTLAPPLATMFAVMAMLSLGIWFRVRKDNIVLSEQENPTELKSALVFTGLFALVLLAVAAARTYLGERGLFAVALLSGLTDMDAITLSTAQLANAGQVVYSTAWRLILAAAMANLVFKAGCVSALGTRELAMRIWLLFIVTLLAGAGIIAFWPA